MVAIQVVRGDITEENVDAVVTAANESLLGGGGVDGAVHRAAGPRLAEAGAAIGPCPPGDAMATPAFDLDPPIRHVIHTVGRSGKAVTKARQRSSPRATAGASRSQMSWVRAAWPSPPSPPVFTDIPPTRRRASRSQHSDPRGLASSGSGWSRSTKTTMSTSLPYCEDNRPPFSTSLLRYRSSDLNPRIIPVVA